MAGATRSRSCMRSCSGSCNTLRLLRYRNLPGQRIPRKPRPWPVERQCTATDGPVPSPCTVRRSRPRSQLQSQRQPRSQSQARSQSQGTSAIHPSSRLYFRPGSCTMPPPRPCRHPRNSNVPGGHHREQRSTAPFDNSRSANRMHRRTNGCGSGRGRSRSRGDSRGRSRSRGRRRGRPVPTAPATAPVPAPGPAPPLPRSRARASPPPLTRAPARNCNRTKEQARAQRRTTM